MSDKDISEINIIYDINGNKNIHIFGYAFVGNNKNTCKMIIDNKEYELQQKYNVKNNNNNNILKIKLLGINNIINMNSMFCGCSSLSSLPDISKWNINNVKDMRYMFCGCSSLSSLPDISKWDKNIRSMFRECLNIILSKVIKAKFNRKF